MKRVRISTTVDGERLALCRRLFKGSDSRMIDSALKALLEELEGLADRRALEAHPYDADPELAWDDRGEPALPYDGAVPKAVVARARARRRSR